MIKEHIFLKFDFLSLPAAHTYLLQETKSEQNQFPSLFSTITLPQKTCSMDWYIYIYLYIWKNANQFSVFWPVVTSLALWPWFFNDNFLSVWCFHKETSKFGGLSMSIYFTGGYSHFWDKPNGWPIPQRGFCFFGADRLPRFVWHAEWKTAPTAVTALNIITYVGESLQSSMVSRQGSQGDVTGDQQSWS